MDSKEYLNILNKIKNKNYNEGFKLLFEKDKNFWNDKLIWNKFTADINRLNEQKKIKEVNDILNSIIDLKNFPKEKNNNILKLGLKIFDKEDNVYLLNLMKKMLYLDKDNENLNKEYIKILNEIIMDKLKEKKFGECRELIEEGMKINNSNEKMCYMHSIRALLNYEEGNFEESLRDIDESIYLFNSINNNEEKDSAKEIKDRIFDIILLCFSKKYDDLIKEEKIEEAEQKFNGYISKFNDQKIKNKFIDKCADILSTNHKFLLAYNKMETIKEDIDEYNNHKIEIISKYIKFNLENKIYDEKIYLKLIIVMTNIISNDLEIQARMCNSYSLFIDNFYEKNEKDAINFLQNQLKYFEESTNKNSEQYKKLKSLVQNKLKEIELSSNKETIKNTNNEQILSLINRIYNETNDFQLNKLSPEEENIIEDEIKNENNYIKEKALKLNINLIKQGKIVLKEETSDYLMNNIIQIEDINKNNDKENKEPTIEDEIIADISSELIFENLKKKGKVSMDKEAKKKIEKGLDIKDKTIKNNLLSAYSHIDNLDINDIQKPMKLLEKNIIFENDRKIVDNSVEILNNFLKQNSELKINNELTNGLVDFIFENDFNNYNENDRIYDEEKENKKNLFEKIKDEVNEEVRKNLIETLKINDEKTQKELKKHFKEKGYDLNKKKLESSQIEKKNTTKKIFQCINNIAENNKGLPEEILNNMNHLFENTEKENTQDYSKFIKKNIIKTVDKVLCLDKNSKIPKKLVDNISNELGTKQQKKILKILDKVSDNQNLQETAQKNLFNILEDNIKVNSEDENNTSSSLNSSISEITEEDDKYETSYKILNKNKEQLKSNQKKILTLIENSQNIKKEKNDILKEKNLDNILNIVQDGYKINEYSKKIIANLIKKEDVKNEILDKSTDIINEMAKNKIDIDEKVSKIIMNKIEKREENKIPKNSFMKLMSCLINIIDKCKVPENCIKTFEIALKQYHNKEKNSEIELVIKGLSILSKKHYTLNSEEINICLDILDKNNLEEKSISELINTLDIIFKETNILENTYNKLFKLMMNNKNLFSKLSQYLVDSLKFKNKKEIGKLIKDNINNLENLIKRKQLNENIIYLILSVDKRFYENSKIIKDFYEFEKYCKHERNLKDDNFCLYNSYIKEYGIIDIKYFNLLYDNLDFSYPIMVNILKNNKNLIDYLEYTKLFNEKNKKIENPLNIIVQFFDENKIDEKCIDILVDIAINNNDKIIYEPIQKIFKLISNDKIEKFPQRFSNIIKLEIMDMNKLDNENFKIIKNVMKNSYFIPERYLTKIYDSLKNYESHIQIYFLNLIIFLLNRDIKIPEKILNTILDEKSLSEIYTSINLDSKDYIAGLFENIFCNIKRSKIYFNSINTFLQTSNEDILSKAIKNAKDKIEFSDLDECFRNIIIENFSKMANHLSDYKYILYWIYSSDTITKEKNQIILSELKKTNFWNDLSQLENCNSSEEQKKFCSEEIYLEKIINDISNNNKILKEKIEEYKNFVLEKRKVKTSSLNKLLRIINSQKYSNNMKNDIIIRCFNYFMKFDFQDILLFSENNNNYNYFNSLRKKWITYLLNISQIIIDKNETILFQSLSDELIEYFTSLKNIQKDFKKLMLFLQNNKELINEISKIFITLKNYCNSIPELLSNTTFAYINEIRKISIDTKFKLFISCFIKIDWKIKDIITFITSDLNLNNKDEFYLKKIIIPIIEENKLFLDDVNQKKENIIDIFQNYEEEDWELWIKDLSIEKKLKGIDENNLNMMLDLLREKNKGKIKDELIERIKYLIENTRYCFNSVSKTGISNKKINQYEDKEILDWAKSNYTKNNICNENFLSEALAVIDRALQLDTKGHRLRNVQLASIFIILLSPKNRGLFAQIKTGEGKSNIVACIAIVKALQIQYVDILSSSIVLAMRDAEEKSHLYGYFGLTCSSTSKTLTYQENIIYGDTLGFEGDILKFDFHNGGKYNGNRDYRCLIVDEVDSMCIDHLGDSTRLCAPFPSYDFLIILYPFIYNSLREIDNYIDNGSFGEIKEEKREEFACERLKFTIKEFLAGNNKNNELKVIIPENLKKYIDIQIPLWCKNAYKAKHFMRLNKDYVLGKREITDEEKEELKKNNLIPVEYFRICPVDFLNTGVISQSMVWSDGLSQFLQIKHGLKLQPEDLTTTFLSHYSFIRRYINQKYGNNIYGVTGTLGMESSQNLLKYLFNVEIYIIPPFRPSRLNILEGISNFQNETEWKNEIIKNIIHHACKLNRAILVISLTIEESDFLYDELFKDNNTKNLGLSLYKYQRNDTNENQLKSKYGPREIIFATNLAGRGTDIGLLETVAMNGGMHVIITFIPENSRIEEQALGRTARSGAKGTAIIIPNKKENISSLKKIRDENENKRIEDIQNRKINEIKLKDDLFQKFTAQYKKLKENKYYTKVNLFFGNLMLGETLVEDQRFSEAVSKDAEETWGLWLKENIEGKFIEKENDIINSFNKLNKQLDNEYIKFNKDLVEFQNPYNYFTSEIFEKAYQKNKDICFYGNYIKNMNDIYGCNSDDTKRKAILIIQETINSIKNNIISQLGSTSLIAEHVKNYTLNLNKKELSIDIEQKVNSLQSLLNILETNKAKIENVLDNDKAKIFTYTRNLSKVSKFQNAMSYLNSIGINYYFDIDIEVEKDWFGIFFVFFLGACEIVAGCFLYGIGLGNIGTKLISEGIEDIKYGFECLLGEKQFSWKELGRRKMVFIIKIITSETLKWVFSGFKNPFNKINLNAAPKDAKKYFNVVKDHIIEVGKQKIIGYTVNKVLGPNFFETIVKKLKEFVKTITKPFMKKLRDILNKKYSAQIKQMIAFDTIEENDFWQKLLSRELRIALRCLSRILKLFVTTILNLLKSLIKSDSWENKLTNIFIDLSQGGLDILKQSLEDSLENAQLTFLEIFKKFVQKDIKDISDKIYTLDGYLNKAFNLPEKSKELMNTLVENNIINWDGEINGKLINNNPFYNPKFNFKFPMEKIRNVVNNAKNYHDKIMDISQVNLKQFQNKKNEIIKKIREINQKIEQIDFDKKQNIIIDELEICLGNEVLDIFFEAINNLEITKFLKDNIKNAQEIITKAYNSVSGN